jgi:hypothetical protein
MESPYESLKLPVPNPSERPEMGVWVDWTAAVAAASGGGTTLNQTLIQRPLNALGKLTWNQPNDRPHMLLICLHSYY